MSITPAQLADAVKDLKGISHFISQNQKAALLECLEGEEASGYAEMIKALKERIDTMPVTYQQDGKGDNAIAYLHYFLGGNDWYITEKDMEDGGTYQAFGLASLNGGYPEIGYISIEQLVRHGVELDLYFDPAPLSQLKKKFAAV